MAKLKMYRFKDYHAFTSNTDLVVAIGEAPHVRQISVVVAATSKKAALGYLNAVGFGINAREVHLTLSVSPRNQKMMDEGHLQEGTVLASSTTPSVRKNFVLLTPTDNPYAPAIKVIALPES